MSAAESVRTNGVHQKGIKRKARIVKVNRCVPQDVPHIGLRLT
jgi:hypothetical protein